MSRPVPATDGGAIADTGRRWLQVVAGIVIVGWYLVATLPHLEVFPIQDWPQMGIMAPAHKLATTGVYGNDLFAGFYDSEVRNYEYMPLYPLLVAASFKVGGTGIAQARLVSVLSGLIVILLTIVLGRQLSGTGAGLIAAAVLCMLKVGVPVSPHHTGIPFVDFARIARYDILVPVFVLGASCLFLWANRRPSRWGFVGVGVLVGFAGLSHLYGLFILPVLCLVLLWQYGPRVFSTPPVYLIAAGLVVAITPSVVYVLQDFAAYRGQMLRHAGRFSVFDPAFYVENLVREVYRYTNWVGSSLRTPVMWPRLGIWVMAAAVPTTTVILWRRARASGDLSDRFLFLALPVLSLLLALLVSQKRYPYLALTMPFFALQIAYGARQMWRRLGERPATKWVGIAIAGALLLESGLALRRAYRTAEEATQYSDISKALREVVPPGSRVLLSQTYWLALHEYATRSINLAFVLSDPGIVGEPAPSVEEAALAIAPDYLVLERYFLESYDTHPLGSSLRRAQAQWRAFGDFVARHCPVEVATISTPDYGEVVVFNCSGEDADR